MVVGLVGAIIRSVINHVAQVAVKADEGSAPILFDSLVVLNAQDCLKKKKLAMFKSA